MRYFRTLQNCLLKWEGNKTSKTDRKDYRQICRIAYEDNEVFNSFKRNKDYRKVLEHVSEKQGQAYLKIIKKEGKNLLRFFEKFKENDIYGSPIKYTYDVGRFSPTTLRYVKVLCDLKNIFGDLSAFKIIEIGGGYGGQCKIISDAFGFKSYTIVDLMEVLLLVNKYLERLKVKNFNCVTQDQLSDKTKYDLIISNYAFSECVKRVQDEYINKILNKTKRGYITYNYDSDKSTLASPMTPYNRKEVVRILSQKHALLIINERPKTGPVNFIIVWDDTGRFKK
jgi:putative sugar O-methyltransferase